MARLKFRISSIALDEEEDVSGITAVVRDDAYRIITDMVGPVETTAAARSGTEITIVLPLSATRELFSRCGELNGLDPRHHVTGEVYDSLSTIFYGLMGE